MIGWQNTAANWDQFLISLQSGVINSLFIGLLVGLLLLWFERRLDRRNEQHQYEREAAAFQERLRFVFTQQHPTNLADTMVSPPLANDIGVLIANSPLELWRQHVPKQQKFFKAIQVFQQAYSKFTSATNSLVVPARMIVRNYNHKLSKVSDYDSAGLLYFLGRIQELKNETILPWLYIGATSEDQLPYFEEIYNLLLSEAQAHFLVSQYKEARTQLGNAMKALKEVL